MMRPPNRINFHPIEDISDFLVTSFGQTEYIVGIFEDREPHLMIGVNTGTRLVGDFLIEDESQKCSVEQVANGEDRKSVV